MLLKIKKDIFGYIRKVDLLRTAFCFKRLDGKEWTDVSDGTDLETHCTLITNVEMEIGYPRFFVETTDALGNARDDLFDGLLDAPSRYGNIPSEEDY